MINSMTGYGCAEGQLDGITFVVEIKTVNNRFFKARVKLPESISFLEEDIEKLLSKDILRGTISYTLRLKNVSADALFNLDEAALRGYMEKLGRLAGEAGANCRVELGGLLSLPGIIQPVVPDEEEAQKVKEKVLNLTREAAEQLKRMRSTEGAALEADMEKNCKAIKEALAHIRQRSQSSAEDYHVRLRKKIDALLSGAKVQIDEATLAREVAIFAEKTDVSEEMARLESHLQQFSQSCREDGQSGRRLDFISQEMLREANTIASKASDMEIIHRVVDIKCRIDRIKEQVQNVE